MTTEGSPWKQNAATPSKPDSKTSASAWSSYGGIFDYDRKASKLKEVESALEDPTVWNNPKRAQELGKEKKSLEDVVLVLDRLTGELADNSELFEMSFADGDEDGLITIEGEAQGVAAEVEKLEFRRMFNNPADPLNCFVDIQAGAGGTEACDWASMLLRQYIRYAERKGFKATVEEETAGDTAGIKSATIKIEGEYAYGWLRTETGVHRLVRKSPFDSNARRHTSFASVFLSPEIDDDINIDLNPADIEMDVYRSSGAGGQHVNKTESAVRLRHLPSGIVVACQSERSQHKNRATAMKMLKAKLYELEVNKRNAAAKVLEDAKSDVSWGNQIRSYVLDQSRIKDLRTDVEIGNTTAVLDGDLDPFLEASLKQGL